MLIKSLVLFLNFPPALEQTVLVFHGKRTSLGRAHTIHGFQHPELVLAWAQQEEQDIYVPTLLGLNNQFLPWQSFTFAPTVFAFWDSSVSWKGSVGDIQKICREIQIFKE